MKTHTPTIEPLEARIAPATLIVTTLTDIVAHSLRAELAIANAPHTGIDTIVFHLGPSLTTLNKQGVMELTGGPLTISQSVIIKGPGPGKVTIDGEGTGRVFYINDGSSTTDSPVTISGLSIVNGMDTGASGGGIYSTESLTLKNVVISGNSAPNSSGGGLAVEGATTVSISNSLITGNTSGRFGGGVLLTDLKTVSIKNTVITGNVATGYSGGGLYAHVIGTGASISIAGCEVSGNTAASGGGLFLENKNSALNSKTIVSGTTITGNTSTATTSDGGGGLLIELGRPTITGSTIEGNKSAFLGGGVEAIGFGSLTIASSTISGNQSTGSGGGGLYLSGSSGAPYSPAKITGTHFNDNQAAANGGGADVVGGVALTVSGSSFSGNRAETGGGISTSAGTDLTVTGSVFTGNAAIDPGSAIGGGICARGAGIVIISGSKLTGNFASFSGGGIYSSFTTSTTIKNVTASDNFAEFGGGASVSFLGDFTIKGGSFKDNGATSGGGIDTYDSTGSISGVTISGNAAASEGGGVLNNGTSGSVSLHFASVLANTAPDGQNEFGSFKSI